MLNLRERNWKAFKRKSLATYYYQDSQISEQYRKLYATIKYSSVEQINKLIIITSPGYKEGKTTTTVNLGTAIAQLGEKVLIVDSDLRKPMIDSLFKMDNHIGLTNILQENKPIHEVINKTGLGTLDVITSGPSPNNSAKLLTSPEMNNFMEMSLKLYDIVLFDTPPLLEVTDANIIANAGARVILVTQHGKTKINKINESKQLLELSRARLIGSILNKKS